MCYNLCIIQLLSMFTLLVLFYIWSRNDCTTSCWSHSLRLWERVHPCWDGEGENLIVYPLICILFLLPLLTKSLSKSTKIGKNQEAPSLYSTTTFRFSACTSWLINRENKDHSNLNTQRSFFLVKIRMPFVFIFKFLAEKEKQIKQQNKVCQSKSFLQAEGREIGFFEFKINKSNCMLLSCYE